MSQINAGAILAISGR